MPSIPPLSVGHWSAAEPEPEPGNTEATPDPQPEKPQGATVHLLPVPAARMTWLEQSNAAVVHACRSALLRARELSRREGGMVHGLMRARPPSVAGQCEYARSRAWVPPAHDGGLAEGMGVVYHALAGRAGVALGNSLSALAARPLRSCIALGVCLVIAVPVLAATHHRLAAVLLALLAAAGVALWAGLGLLVTRASRPVLRAPADDDDPDEETS